MKTVDGQQLLKDKNSVTLPIQMIPDEVKKLSAAWAVTAIEVTCNIFGVCVYAI
nr:hypothetical protein [uncultured Blautia sp.]